MSGRHTTRRRAGRYDGGGRGLPDRRSSTSCRRASRPNPNGMPRREPAGHELHEPGRRPRRLLVERRGIPSSPSSAIIDDARGDGRRLAVLPRIRSIGRSGSSDAGGGSPLLLGWRWATALGAVVARAGRARVRACRMRQPRAMPSQPSGRLLPGHELVSGTIDGIGERRRRSCSAPSAWRALRTGWARSGRPSSGPSSRSSPIFAVYRPPASSSWTASRRARAAGDPAASGSSRRALAPPDSEAGPPDRRPHRDRRSPRGRRRRSSSSTVIVVAAVIGAAVRLRGTAAARTPPPPRESPAITERRS